MFPRPVQLVSTGCANFVASGDRLTRDRQQLLCMLSWRHGLIIAMLSMQELRRRSQISCSECSTPPLEFDCGLSTLLHDKLPWLTVPERVTFKLDLMSTCTSTSVVGTSPITSPQPSKLHFDIGCVPPTDTGSSYHAVGSTRRPSNLSSRWSNGLELTARWTQRSGVWYWQFQTILQKQSQSIPVWRAH